MGKHARYASHLPVLLAAIGRSHGRILELGCGTASTPALRTISLTGRRVVSLENNAAFFQRFAGWSCAAHQVHYEPDVAKWVDWCREPWDVALVDCEPPEARALLLYSLGHVRLVVAHDTQRRCRGYVGMEAALRGFAYSAEATPDALPWTRVVSNVESDLAWVTTITIDDGT